MSYITNVLIQGAPTEAIVRLNQWLDEVDTDRHQQFERINMDGAGGYKVYVPKVWAAAFNYSPSELVAKLRDPETWGVSVLLVSVLIDGEGEREAFVFDKNYGEDAKPVSRQEF